MNRTCSGEGKSRAMPWADDETDNVFSFLLIACQTTISVRTGLVVKTARRNIGTLYDLVWLFVNQCKTGVQVVIVRKFLYAFE